MTLQLKKYIGDRKFYRNVLAVSVPIMLQNGITTLVGLLDNIMVGQLSTEAMSAVTIIGEFIFVFNLAIFGGISGPGIYTAQFHGKGDVDGVRYTFRIKLLFALLVSAVAIAVFVWFPEPLISRFLHKSGSDADLSATMAFAKDYLGVMLIGLIPYAVSQCYASTLRETEQTLVPMLASLSAVATNFILNLILIFGYLGFPALGVTGAAIATVISRFVELAVLVIYGHTNKQKCAFLVKALDSVKMPKELAGRIILRGLPLLANEFFWSLALTVRDLCYSTRGLDVVAAENISLTLNNLFSVIYLALGTAVGILVGKLLGAGETGKARDCARKMVVFSMFAALVMGLLLAAIAPFVPLLYNITDAARDLATYMITVFGMMMIPASVANSCYFSIRAGGQVLITVLFDSGFMWLVTVPTAALLAFCTPLAIEWCFAICQGTEILKAVIGALFLKRGKWAHQLVLREE